MANAKDCITKLGISKEEAEDILKQPWEDLKDLADLDEITFRAIEDNLYSVALKRRQAKLQAISMKRLGEWIAKQPNQKKALESILSSRADTGGLVSVERHQQAILGQFHSQLAEMFESYKVKNLGFGQDQTGPRNMVRELFGQTTGDTDASAFAKMWKEVAEMARERFNKSGGDIHKLATWALPQSHDSVKVGKLGFDEWYKQTLPLLNQEQIYKSLGIAPNENVLKTSLAEVYEFIASDGLKGLDPEKSLVNGTSKMANRHQESRLLHFKDGDSWLKYQDGFGLYDTPYTSMNNYLFIMSREIGIMERMGPNPEHTFNYLRGIVQRTEGKRSAGGFSQRMFNNLAGKMYAEDTALAGVFNTIRSGEVALKLGSAMLSALSDTYFQGMAAKYNGIPILKQVGRFMKNLVPGNKADRIFATRLGFAAEYAMDRAHSTFRYADVMGHGAMAQLADVTIRASGLNHWTEAGKNAFQIEFMGMIGAQVNSPWQKLKPTTKRLFKKYGVTEQEWKVMRKADLEKHGSGSYFNPQNVGDDQLANKLVGMALEEMTYAVPEANVRVRTHLNRGLHAGTIEGELMRTFMQFKTFPITIMTTHLARGLSQDGAWNKLGYMGSLFTGTTVLGAIAYNAKEISKGREPLDWDNPKLWAKGFIQGDGTGIIGDFLMADANDFGQSALSGLLGPALGDLEDLGLKFLTGSAHDLMDMEKSWYDTKGPMAAYMVKKFTPGQLWWNRVLFDRYVFDQLNKLMDPNWNRKQQSMYRKRQKEFGNAYWWKPGKTNPKFME